jgi:hypothetical protein
VPGPELDANRITIVRKVPLEPYLEAWDFSIHGRRDVIHRLDRNQIKEEVDGSGQ